MFKFTYWNAWSISRLYWVTEISFKSGTPEENLCKFPYISQIHESTESLSLSLSRDREGGRERLHIYICVCVYVCVFCVCTSSKTSSAVAEGLKCRSLHFRTGSPYIDPWTRGSRNVFIHPEIRHHFACRIFCFQVPLCYCLFQQTQFLFASLRFAKSVKQLKENKQRGPTIFRVL
jgi:hypothetical protein